MVWQMDLTPASLSSPLAGMLLTSTYISLGSGALPHSTRSQLLWFTSIIRTVLYEQAFCFYLRSSSTPL